MHIIMIGNLIDGFEFIGPFETDAAAIEHANNDPHIDAEWWLVKLDAPDAV